MALPGFPSSCRNRSMTCKVQALHRMYKEEWALESHGNVAEDTSMCNCGRFNESS